MKSFISFLIGAGVGAGSAYVILKNKFEKKINSELLADIAHKEEKAKAAVEGEKAKEEYFKKLDAVKKAKAEGLSNAEIAEGIGEPSTEVKPAKKSSNKKAKKEDVVIAAKEPYEITEDEFDNGGFPHVSLIYHMPSDVLTEYRRNENPDEIVVNNPSELIGIDVLSQFQNSTDDFLYVRNESKGVDYEIMASAKTFRKTKKAAPDKEE